MSCFDRNDCKPTYASHMLHDVYSNKNTGRQEALCYANSAYYHSYTPGKHDSFCSLY